MLTVSKLARRCGLSRSTLLYYESIGLLKPAPRTSANYRRYGEKELQRLQQVCVYREAGLKLEDIRAILDRRENDASAVLKRRLAELNAEIEQLRGHQRAILKLLQSRALERIKMMTKEKWVSIMKAAGFAEADMNRWHTEFERSAPAEHQEFLEFLHIPGDEIRSIREWSRKGGGA
jgi:MerR family transcriptional regulator, thiopeptide resistance regulator